MQCIKCPNNPQLSKLSNNSPAFNTHRSSLCSACGISLDAQKLIYSCSKCSTYVLCSNCRVCSLNHFMHKTIYIKNANSAYYNNTYGCNNCGKTKITNDDGIWRCNACSYDICPECLE